MTQRSTEKKVSGAPLHVLIVDDSATDRKLLRTFLEAEGHRVLDAPDGAEALSILEGTKVDAVISDILMPGMDGYRLCTAVRSSAAHATLPFILLTATYTSPKDEKLAYEIGADSYVHKDGSFKKTLQALRLVTSDPQYRQTRRVDRPNETSVIKEYNRALIEKLEKKNTELEVTEEQLQAFQKRMQDILYANPAVVYTLEIVGGEFRPSWVSDNVKRITGSSEEEVRTGAWWIDRLHPDDRGRILNEQPAILRYGHGLQEYRVRKKDGSYCWVQDRHVLVNKPAGNPLEVVGSWTDITERREMEEALRSSEERYRTLVERMNEGLVRVDAGGVLVFANRKLCEILRHRPEELTGRAMVEIVDKEYRQAYEEQFAKWKNGIGDPCGSVLNGMNGVKARVIISPEPLLDKKGEFAGVVAVVTDMSEVQSLQEQLRQSQKMESLGTLVGGIAHDFGNIIGLIIGHLEMIQRTSASPERLSRGTEMIAQATKRGANLIRQLMTFARKTNPVKGLIEVHEVISEIVTLMDETFPKHITVMKHLQGGLPAIVADSNQLHQVLLNLCVNARDAMPTSGTLEIRSDLITGASVRKKWPEAVSSEYVKITISDTGMGMSEETCVRIFEPFFTTKERGSGTGLGLAVVYGIVRDHHGFIDVESKVGKGTAFFVYLPLPPKSPQISAMK